MTSKLPERLKELRNERGLSQVQLAKKIGCGAGFIADIEIGRCSVSIETLIIFVKFFNCTAGYLIGTEDN